jgi:hypothetical protein
MHFKIVKLLLLSTAFFGILLATSMLMTNVHSNLILGNFAHKPATDISTGDPVGGGFPQCTVLMGDPVGGGFPQVETKL